MDKRKNVTNRIILQNTVELSLDQLAVAINQEHQDCQQAYRASVIHAYRTGELLLQAKRKLPHGQWLPWLAANLPANVIQYGSLFGWS